MLLNHWNGCCGSKSSISVADGGGCSDGAAAGLGGCPDGGRCSDGAAAGEGYSDGAASWLGGGSGKTEPVILVPDRIASKIFVADAKLPPLTLCRITPNSWADLCTVAFVHDFDPVSHFNLTVAMFASSSTWVITDASRFF